MFSEGGGCRMTWHPSQSDGCAGSGLSVPGIPIAPIPASRRERLENTSADEGSGQEQRTVALLQSTENWEAITLLPSAGYFWLWTDQADTWIFQAWLHDKLVKSIAAQNHWTYFGGKLEDHSPAEFSSKSNQTHLNKLAEVWVTRKLQVGEFDHSLSWTL